MATAAVMCKPHASEARRSEAESRAVGVSRAERGSDGSPNGGETRTTRLDAQHDSATGLWPEMSSCRNYSKTVEVNFDKIQEGAPFSGERDDGQYIYVSLLRQS